VWAVPQVCGDYPFTHEDAQVVCRQLGIPGLALKVPGAFSGPGAAPWSGISFFVCNGNEPRLDACPQKNKLPVPCDPRFTFSVACNASGEPRPLSVSMQPGLPPKCGHPLVAKPWTWPGLLN